jgi:hypothetical protein
MGDNVSRACPGSPAATTPSWSPPARSSRTWRPNSQ